MKTNPSNARYGNLLLIAMILILFTMVLHPTGGSIAYIQKIRTMLMTTHMVAILSVPFWLMGFWGLYRHLEDDSLLALAGFANMCVGLFAIVLAGAANGIVLPLFLDHYQNASPDIIKQIMPIVMYNASLNHAFDLIYTITISLAIVLWSAAVLKTRRMPVWVGIAGIVLVLASAITVIPGFFFTTVAGFRIFGSGFVIWTLLMVIYLRRTVVAGE